MAPNVNKGTTNEGYQVDEYEGAKSSSSSSSDITEESQEKTKTSWFKKKKDEKSEEEGKKPTGPPPVPYFKLFRYATFWDVVLIIIGVIAGAGTGLSFPAMIIFFGDLTDGFVSNGQPPPINSTDPGAPPVCGAPNTTTRADFGSAEDELMATVERFAIGVSIIGASVMLLGYLFVTCLNAAAENQVYRIRGLFFQSIVRQDIGWYDVSSTNDFASRITEDLNKLQEGIGEKIGMFLFSVTGFLAAIVNAFVHGWELTLVILAPMPVLVIAMGFLGKITSSLAEKESNAYGKAGAIAEEVLSGVRTVMAFGGAEKEVERYDKNLVFARKTGIQRGLTTGVSLGIAFVAIYGSYALAFWYGTKLILDGLMSGVILYDSGDLIIVFFSVLGASFSIGQLPTYMEAFATARGSAAAIFQIIDRVPPIDSTSEKGLKPKKFDGTIRFEDVHFNYPSRPEVKILRGLNIEIRPGETVALVGSSGCGKSTCIQLIQRFYDPIEGKVFLDGHDIRDLHVGWLRSHIGIVGQEPVLFGTTIKENIRYGKPGVTDDDIIRAAKEANAHDFIYKLPLGYDTLVGDRGTQLSGGQKQRVAIARALVRNPKLLLLDEATSALDNQSEAVVQKALDKARKGRTTIIVAHRLSTIRNADLILVMNEGVLKERGTHDELMKQDAIYASLVKAQQGANLTAKKKKPVFHDEISGELSDEGDEANSLLSSLPSSMARQASLRSSKSKSKRRSSSMASSIQEQLTPALEAEEPEKEISMVRLLKANSPEWIYLIFGVLGSCVVGGANIAFAIVFGEVLGSLSFCDIETARQETLMYSLLFLLIGIFSGVAGFLQAYMFSVAGERLTSRIRNWTFKAMLQQEMGWFDREENSVGSLCARLSGDAASIQGATGSRLGTISQAVVTIAVAVGLSLSFDYRLGLVTACFIPLVLVSTFLQTKIVMSQSAVERKAIEKSAKVALESISNIRTVAGLSLEKLFLDKYIEELRGAHERTVRRSHVRGGAFGFSQAIPNWAYAVCMYYGGYLVTQGEMVFEDVFKTSESLIFGTMMVGQAVAFAPNYNKAKVAAMKIFNLLDRVPKIDTSLTTGNKLSSVQGNVDYTGIKFSYPTRQQTKVLDGLQLSIKEGQTVALVGHSGCGKSTCLQLLLRFYDPEAGEVRVDGKDINPINVPQLRSFMGIVSQEPTLFNRTLADNIAYGDSSRAVSMDEIINAARKANIHNFISGLPAGYDTYVGERGAQLSGGQKQRIAIARALIRSPKILLLDEATSALDSESEKVVQEALDQAREGRTCITIAHRLSTIQSADCIYVLSEGQVREKGTHKELIEKGGLYYDLYTTQGGQFLPN